MKKNILLKDAYREEVRETVLGFSLALFFFVGCGVTVWLWLQYSSELNLTEAVQAAFATCYAFGIGAVLIRFGGGHAIVRGKKAAYYYQKLAASPVEARGRR